MEVKGLMLDPTSNVPIVILRDEKGVEFLPIWIGVFEANAIALKLEDVEPPRPMTHDLLASLLTALEAEVLRVIISDLQESTFHARIVLQNRDGEIEVDARPSDAIALALRVEAPIFVTERVFSKAKAADTSDLASDEEKLKKWFEDVDPDDLGKYTM
jgi:hypothetical protein